MRSLLIAGLAVAMLSGCVVIEPQGSQATSTDQLLPDNAVGQALNRERAAAGLAPLTRSALLSQAAERLSRDMEANGFFGHTGSDGSDNTTRIRDTGYGGCFFAENLTQGSDTATGAMARWMDSAPHRANALDKRATEYGTARIGKTWVMTFGAQCKKVPGGLVL